MNKSKSKYKRIKSDKNNDLKKINIGLQLLRSICSLLIIIAIPIIFNIIK